MPSGVCLLDNMECTLSRQMQLPVRSCASLQDASVREVYQLAKRWTAAST